MKYLFPILLLAVSAFSMEEYGGQSSGGSPTGSASGDLGGTYPGPTVVHTQSGSVDFSTMTTALNTKLSSGAIPSGFVNFSTITTAINVRASSGTNADLSSLLGAGASITVSTSLIVASTVTIQGNAFSVGGSTFVIVGSSVGIGTTNPNAALDVVGQMYSRSFSGGTATTLNLNNGNVQYVSTGGVAGVLTLNNLYDGDAVSIVVTDTTGGTTSFSSGGVTFKYSPANAVRTASKDTVYTILRAGAIGYVSWITGF